jgi:hypothetical protein
MCRRRCSLSVDGEDATILSLRLKFNCSSKVDVMDAP